MIQSIKHGIISHISDQLNIDIFATDVAILNNEFNIVGSENNPHIMTEDGLIFNDHGDSISNSDLRRLLYAGIEKCVSDNEWR